MVAAAVKELYAQFLLQLHQLPGEGGLGHMEQLRCPGDVLLAGDRQEIAQCAKFHSITLLGKA